MTKEVKLALILGFLVTLVVSILISDHLSQARDAQIESAGDETRMVSGSGLYPVQAPRNLAMPLTPDNRSMTGFAPPPREPETVVASRQPVVSPVRELSTALSQPVNQAADGTSIVDPIQLAGPASEVPSWQDLSAPHSNRAEFEPLVIRQRIASNDQNEPTLSLSDALRKFRSQLPTLTNLQDADAQATDTDRTRAKPTHTGVARGTSQVDQAAEPGPGYWYIVKQNDSLTSIARDELGTGNRWREIADVNPQRLLPDNGVRIGVRLWIPSDPKASEKPAPDSTRSATPAEPKVSANTTAPSKPVPVTVAREYTVQAGDSLSKIASRELGAAARYTEIKAMNGLDTDDIRVGQVLKLPERSAAQGR